jgi:hypothetical protein
MALEFRIVIIRAPFYRKMRLYCYLFVARYLVDTVLLLELYILASRKQLLE